MQPKVLVATPTFDGQVSIEYLFSMLRLKEQLDFQLSLIPGVHFVDQARDMAAAKFMQSDCEYLFFIDSDLLFPAEAAMRIVGHGKPVCGGAYRIKNDQHLYPEYGVVGNEDGLLKVSMLPGGFTCIRRDVVEHLWNSCPHYTYAGTELAAMFARELHDGVMVSEDAMFSRRAAPFGLWLDPDIDFSHVGKQSWRGNYAEQKEMK
jgi:hypothetical protein